MPIDGIFANIACTDLEHSHGWYAALFGRSADAHPMEGLAEWHMGGHGVQLHQNAANAGHGTLTLRATGLRAERERLSALTPDPLKQGDQASLLQLRDPDGNLVVLAGSE